MKRTYISPEIHLHILAQNLLAGLSGGGPDNGNADAESKRNSYLINDDDNIFDDRSSYDEEESYNHFDL